MPDCQHTKFKFLMYLPEQREYPGRLIRVYQCPCGVQLDDATDDRSLQVHTPKQGDDAYAPWHRRADAGSEIGAPIPV